SSPVSDTLSLHAALPICPTSVSASHGIADSCFIPASACAARDRYRGSRQRGAIVAHPGGISSAGTPLAIASARTTARRRYGDQRSEEHTSELQSRENLVC